MQIAGRPEKNKKEKEGFSKAKALASSREKNQFFNRTNKQTNTN
jgi:hypothetical protein